MMFHNGKLSVFRKISFNLIWQYLLCRILTWKCFLKYTSQSLKVEVKKVISVLKSHKSSDFCFLTFPGFFIAVFFLTDVGFAPLLKDILGKEILQNSRLISSSIQLLLPLEITF